MTAEASEGKNSSKMNIGKSYVKIKIEHCPALFILGNITKMANQLVPIYEEAMRFKVSADYDVSVKLIATIIVKRC